MWGRVIVGPVDLVVEEAVRRSLVCYQAMWRLPGAVLSDKPWVLVGGRRVLKESRKERRILNSSVLIPSAPNNQVGA